MKKSVLAELSRTIKAKPGVEAPGEAEEEDEEEGKEDYIRKLLRELDGPGEDIFQLLMKVDVPA